MEIGSAYALQVCLLQIPAMVAFSAWYAPERMGSVAETFTYVPSITPKFPQLTARVRIQANLPPLGHRRDHPLRLPHDVHVHRGQEQLPPRQHPHPQVRILLPILICVCDDTDDAFTCLRSYVVLVSGFYYAPNRADEDEIEVFLRPLQQAFTGAVSLFTTH